MQSLLVSIKADRHDHRSVHVTSEGNKYLYSQKLGYSKSPLLCTTVNSWISFQGPKCTNVWLNILAWKIRWSNRSKLSPDGLSEIQISTHERAQRHSFITTECTVRCFTEFHPKRTALSVTGKVLKLKSFLGKVPVMDTKPTWSTPQVTPATAVDEDWKRVNTFSWHWHLNKINDTSAYNPAAVLSSARHARMHPARRHLPETHWIIQCDFSQTAAAHTEGRDVFSGN